MFRFLLALPLLLILVVFALSNAQSVRLGLWPTDLSLELPLALAVLAGMGIAFLIGAVVLWFSLLGARMRAHRAEHAANLLEAQVTELKAELTRLRTHAASMQAAEQGRAVALPSWQG